MYSFSVLILNFPTHNVHALKYQALINLKKMWNKWILAFKLSIKPLILNTISELRSHINYGNLFNAPPENLASILSQVTWTKEDAFRKTSCSTFGKICFVNYENSKPAKVVVCVIFIRELLQICNSLCLTVNIIFCDLCVSKCYKRSSTL